MDNVDGLLGVDPDDTQDVAIGGAVFTIGPIPGEIWEKLTSQRNLLMRDAMRLSIKRIAERGENPEDPYQDRHGKTYEGLTKVESESYDDPMFASRMVPVMLEAAKHSVRSHAKFFTKKGKEVPFVRTNNQLGAETLRYYEVNPTVLQALWVKMYELNALGDVGKKA